MKQSDYSDTDKRHESENSLLWAVLAFVLMGITVLLAIGLYTGILTV